MTIMSCCLKTFDKTDFIIFVNTLVSKAKMCCKLFEFSKFYNFLIKLAFMVDFKTDCFQLVPEDFRCLDCTLTPYNQSKIR